MVHDSYLLLSSDSQMVIVHCYIPSTASPVFTGSVVDNQGLILDRGKGSSYGNWGLFPPQVNCPECEARLSFTS